MSSDFSPELRKELLDDFYAECDDLLTSLRESLTTLERALAERTPMVTAVEKLFRGVHSLKGIAAIAGVRPAEQLAHGMEDLLRALSKNEVPINGERLELLVSATHRLEQIITAHRAGKKPPKGSAMLDALRMQAGASRESAAKKETAKGAVGKSPSREAAPDAATADLTAVARQRGLEPWRCLFAPSKELDRRGVNLANVRERLGRIGEILAAVPVIQPNASIIFMFTVGLRESPADLAAWEADGMRFERITSGASSDAPSPPEVGVKTAEGGEDALSLAPSHMVRVDLARLDDLMRIAGEMVIQRSRLEDRIQQQFGGHEALKEIDQGLARSLRALRKAITRVRLVSVGEIFTRMPFVVRDLEPGSGKAVRVALEGHQTEIDKYLVERLKEPLLHLVRNAFSHGIETPAERAAAGKPEEATITLRATSLGETVAIQVRDDGRGIDVEAVVRRARALGLAVPEHVDAGGVLEILCAPGFSTRDEVDRASGRGVGMAVAANTVRELGGTLTFETALGRGTQFTLRLPLTLSIAEAIIVTAGGETCAVPQVSVDEIIQVATSESRGIRDTEVVPYRGGLLPFTRLSDVFGIEGRDEAMLTLLVLSSERGATGLAVDRVKTRREVVVRPLTDPLVHVRGISGATELGDGRPILILDPAALTSGVVRPAGEFNEMVLN